MFECESSAKTSTNLKFFFKKKKNRKRDEALRNANLEVARLSKLLEAEIARADHQKSKLEEEIRILKRESKFHNLPCILSPPSRRGSTMTVAPTPPHPSASRKYGRYVIGLTGEDLDDAVGIFQQLGATVVDVDTMAVGLCQPGSTLSIASG